MSHTLRWADDKVYTSSQSNRDYKARLEAAVRAKFFDAANIDSIVIQGGTHTSTTSGSRQQRQSGSKRPPDRVPHLTLHVSGRDHVGDYTKTIHLSLPPSLWEPKGRHLDAQRDAELIRAYNRVKDLHVRQLLARAPTYRTELPSTDLDDSSQGLDFGTKFGALSIDDYSAPSERPFDEYGTFARSRPPYAAASTAFANDDCGDYGCPSYSSDRRYSYDEWRGDIGYGSQSLDVPALASGSDPASVFGAPHAHSAFTTPDPLNARTSPDYGPSLSYQNYPSPASFASSYPFASATSASGANAYASTSNAPYPQLQAASYAYGDSGMSMSSSATTYEPSSTYAPPPPRRNPSSTVRRPRQNYNAFGDEANY